MKRIAMFSAIVALFASVALAGFDQYNSKNYTTCLNPKAVTTSAAVITNSTSTGVDIAGLPGNGCMVFAYQCNNQADAVLSFSLSSSATTNGTYATYTNADGVSAWAYTNAAGFGKILFRPNSVSRYLRVTVTPTAVTNGVAGAVLVTE
jgi:hypothetical protein